jgi:signal peptidase I
MNRRTIVLVSVAVSIFVLPLLLRAYVVEAFKIPAGSMIPTLQVGDHMFVDKHATHPTRGDVIVFKYPKEPDKDFVKRVIAVGGDTVSWQGESPVINGTPIARTPAGGECSYFDREESGWSERRCRAFDETLDGRTWRIIQEPTESYRRDFPTVTVPAGAFYVLGDNRDNSHDSRYWGFVPQENVKGTAMRIWYSSGPEGKSRTERIGQKIR